MFKFASFIVLGCLVGISFGFTLNQVAVTVSGMSSLINILSLSNSRCPCGNKVGCIPVNQSIYTDAIDSSDTCFGSLPCGSVTTYGLSLNEVENLRGRCANLKRLGAYDSCGVGYQPFGTAECSLCATAGMYWCQPFQMSSGYKIPAICLRRDFRLEYAAFELASHELLKAHVDSITDPAKKILALDALALKGVGDYNISSGKCPFGNPMPPVVSGCNCPETTIC